LLDLLDFLDLFANLILVITYY